MKNIFYLLILLLSSGLWSCYDDKSTYDTEKLPEIKIDLENISDVQRTTYLGNLKIDIPITKDGQANHPDLGYLWKIQLGTSSLDYVTEELSHERVLDMTANMPINAGGYKLLLTVTDSATTLQYFASFTLVVTSEFGEGLVVAHSQDGQTSDLSLVMDENLTKDFTGERKVISNIYASKGEVFPDKIKNMMYTVSGSTYGTYRNILWVAGEKGAYRIDVEDYSYTDTKSIVPMADASFEADAFYPSAQVTLMVANQQIYQHLRQNDNMFVKPEKITNVQGLESNYLDNAVLASAVGDNGNRANAVWYDSNMECFGRFNSYYSAPKCQLFSSSEYNQSFPFDPSNIRDKEAIAGGMMERDGLAMVLRDKTTQEYEIYIFKTQNSNYDLIAPTPYALYNVPAGLKTVMDAAVSYTFSSVDPIMYVATETDVYAVRMSLGTLTYESKYTVASGEKISIVRFYMQGRYNMDPTEFDSDASALVPLNAKAVLIATQAGDAGKVYLVPQKDLGTGNLDKEKQVTYDGFGVISNIVVQGK
ncbi:PKD-like family lipoprotein [uncultured Sanguibacteroides sp.]|uniref:PKD-like family lipoprotein n=1 Tax=uncultured Sanguibacteroides sp. TaxID=1635151 RepID=UPI0025E96652|nr:PKD-like family lipoprotein [uncultured Sanguibacteroides sp.]